MAGEIAALIVAAGRGARARREDNSAPKQYVPLLGLPVLAHSLRPFFASKSIDRILVVIHEDDQAAYNEVVEALGTIVDERLLPFVIGGATRQESVFAGLSALNECQPDHVLIHDGARPLLDAALLDRVVDALDEHEAVLPCVAVADTLKRAEQKRVLETVDRAGLWRAQTPQGFRFSTIFAAHSVAAQENKTDFTDDASLVEWRGPDVHIVDGSEDNIKITTAADFDRGARILEKTLNIRVGNGFDVHAFEPGDGVILCGVTVPFDRKLKGHSDADVGLHALTDALYGALGVGDIGQHFPPTDPQWKGTASDVFLKHAADMVTSSGGRISNVDVTLICEAPKIGPHVQKMREAIAKIIGLEVGQVGVKATTTEGLGFTGRGEGIAAMASALIVGA